MEVIHHETGRDPLYKVWNTVKGNMIMYVYSDGGSIVFQEAIYPMKRGTLCFIGKNKLHYTMPKDPESYDRSKFIVGDDTLDAIISTTTKESDFHRLFLNNSFVCANIPQDAEEEVEKIFMSAREASERERGEMLVCCFYRLMIYLKDHAIAKIPAPKDSVSIAIDYINKNYSENITLDGLCSMLHISKYHFCRKFKESMGVTVMEYLLDTRIAAAKNMLVLENISITDVSLRCGFSSVYYFCQIFRKKMGMTAREYRAISI